MPVYLEGQEDNATTNFSFDQTGGSAKAFYYVESSGAQYLLDTIKDILGYTNPFALTGVSSGGQALQRTIPRTHPKFPFMYASKISSLVGMGSAAAVQSSPEVPSLPAIGSKPIANYQQFSKYQIGIEFTGPRPYAIL